MFASLTSASSISVCLSKQNPQITAKTIQELDSRIPTISNWRRFFSSNLTRQRCSQISSLSIHPQIGRWLNLHGYCQQPPNPSPPLVMLESPRLFLSLSLSLSYLGFSIFSFSQAQPWLSYCFHSHLSLLAVPLIGITTIGGRRSSSLILYFLSLQIGRAHV